MVEREPAETPSRLFLKMDDTSWDDYSEYRPHGIVRRPFGVGARVTFQVVMPAETLKHPENPRPGLSIKDAAAASYELVGRIRKVRVMDPSPSIRNPVASVLVDAGLPVTVNTNKASLDKLVGQPRASVLATGILYAICFRYWWVDPVAPLKGKVERIETTAGEDTFIEFSELKRAKLRLGASHGTAG